MKQLIIRKGMVSLDNVPAPSVETGYVLVETLFSCLSPGTEKAALASARKPLWKRALEKPERVVTAIKLAQKIGVQRTQDFIQSRVMMSARPTGYSLAGVVRAVGTGVTGISVGDRVACMGNQCAYHAEFVSVPQNLVCVVPNGVDLADASTVALGCIALHGVRRLEPTLGETVLVIGLGLIGQLTSQFLQANGCRVIGVDPSTERLTTALELGLSGGITASGTEMEEWVARLTGGQGVDGVVITAATSSNQVVSDAFRCCRRKGRIALVGDVGLQLQRKDFYTKEIDFRISTSYGPGRYDDSYERKGLDYPLGYVRWTEQRNMQCFVEQLACGALRLSKLINKPLPLSDAGKAYEELISGASHSIVTVLEYPQSKELSFTIQRRVIAAIAGRVGIGLIGAGRFAQSTLLPQLKKHGDRLEIKAVATRSGLSADSVVRSLGAAAYATTDFRQILADSAVHAVVIATRHDQHAAMVLESLKAGKHVFVEKPLALNETELQSILEFYADGTDGKPSLTVGYNRRFAPCIEELKKALRGREHPITINYVMNAGYQAPESWLHSAEGGGRNVGEACHIYDLFLALTESPAVDVTHTALKPRTGYYRSDDNFVTTVRHADGSLSTLTYTAQGHLDHPKEVMTLFGNGWVAQMEDYQTLRVSGRAIPYRTKHMDKGHTREIEHWKSLLLDGGDWLVGLEDLAQSSRISFVQT